MKIAINADFGGFSLSREAYEYLGVEWDGYGCSYRDRRADPKLIECIEKLGSKASGECACVKVVEIPDGVEWEIDEYDGAESVHEKHRSWR